VVQYYCENNNKNKFSMKKYFSNIVVDWTTSIVPKYLSKKKPRFEVHAVSVNTGGFFKGEIDSIQ